MAESYLLGKLKCKVLVIILIILLIIMCLFVFSGNHLTSYPSAGHIKSNLLQIKGLFIDPKHETLTHLHQTFQNVSGYIVTLTYNSQMTRAIRNLMGQQCWARSLAGSSLSITEPFSSESKLVHYRRFWEGLKKRNLYNAVLFGEYFDLDFYNQVSLNENSAPLMKWTEFLLDNKTPRKLVAVTLPSGRCDFGASTEANIPNQNEPCFYGKNFNELIAGLRERFDIISIKKVCLDCSKLEHRLTLTELRNMIFGTDTDISQYIILINTWRNFAFTQSWLKVPDYCKNAENPNSSKRLISSKSVAAHSKLYRERIIQSKRVVAVMFRIERFLTLKVLNKSNESLTSCIKKTLQVHDNLMGKGASKKSSGTFITLDIGRFGSKLMKDDKTVSKYGQDSLESISKSVQEMIPKIYSGQFKTIEEYEDSFIEITGGITERGYISMVQRSIATEADCLIVMGGGSYQQVAISQYLSNHPNPSKQCIQAVCVAENVLNLLPKHSTV